MHDHSNGVDWGSWLRTRGEDLRHPHRMIVPLGGGRHCLLCDTTATGPLAEHHLQHMLDLDAWLAGSNNAQPGPKPDSIRRSRDREARRQRQAEQAEAFGRDRYQYAVERVEKVNPTDKTDKRVRPVVRRRLRHPKDETITKVIALRAEGRDVKAIANSLDKTENYIARLIRQIEGQGASNVAR